MNPSKELIQMAETMAMTMAFEQLMREKVEGYQRAILKEHQWPVTEKYASDFPGAILEPNRSYLLSKAHSEVYYAKCEQARIAAGLTVSREGNCPLLEAKTLLVKAETELIREVAKTPGLSGLAEKMHMLSLARRKEAVDLAMRWTAPFMRASDAILQGPGAGKDKHAVPA